MNLKNRINYISRSFADIIIFDNKLCLCKTVLKVLRTVTVLSGHELYKLA